MTARDDYEERDEMREGNWINYSAVCNQDRTDNNERDVIVKFIADSGATEHLSRTELIFEKLNDNVNHTVRCANKGSSLKTVGSASVKFKRTKEENLY